MTEPAGVAELSVTGRTMDLNEQKARYGVAYLRSICAQAGVGMDETSPGEDVLAVDCKVEFPEAPVRVQVKCTSTLTIEGRTARVALDGKWLTKWRQSCVPVYVALVIVPGDARDWLAQREYGTFHRTAAFWRRVRPDDEPGSRLDIPKDQRVAATTLSLWHADLMEVFNPGGQP